MKKLTLGLICCAATIGLPEEAHATHKYQVVHDSCVKALSVEDAPFTRILDVLICGETARGNFRLRSWIPGCYSSPSCFEDREGNGAEGISITRNADWLIAKDSKTGSSETIWTKAFGGWQTWPKNLCGGGTIDIRTKAGDRTIAAAADKQVYVVQHRDGRDSTAWWNGSCWWPMPQTPSGSVLEVGIFDEKTQSVDTLPWVVTDNMQMFYWNHTAWVSMLPGIAMGIGDNDKWLIGSDGVTLWKFDHATFTFSHFTDWTFGAITMTNHGHVVAPDGRLWIKST